MHSNFAGSEFTLTATCPSGATTRTLYVGEEAAEKIAAVLSEVLEEEKWVAKEVSG